MPDLVGAKLGAYEITARVASGALAEVYRAYNPSLGREVAVKVYRPHLAGDAHLAERLREQARRVAALRHPHIAQIYDCDVATVAGQPLLYVVSEFAEGATLKDRMSALKAKGQVMPLSDVADLVRAIGSALDYAHSRGVIHGGIKPTNVLFTGEGEPVLADFGMARVCSAALQALPADPAGAPAYMSPEQIRGDPIDARADIYALGVLLYEMCTNTLPFVADTSTGVMMRHLTEMPPRPSQANPDLPLAVEQVILKALSKSPGDRYATAGEMAAALDAAIAGVAAPAAAPATAGEVAAPAEKPAGLKALLGASASALFPAKEGQTAGERESRREGVRSLLVQILAIFTTVLALLEKFTKAVDIMRNPLIGLIVVGVGLGAMVLSAGYVLARPGLYKPWQRRLAAAGLALTVLAAAGWGGWTVYEMKRPPKGLIVLIADFQPFQNASPVDYAAQIQDGLTEALRQLKVEGIYVERANEVYTEKDARSRAAARKATVVIYGSYDTATVRPRFELVRAPQQFLPILKEANLKLAALNEFDAWMGKEFREMTYIALSAIGLAYYADGQNETALAFFERALASLPEGTQLKGREAVYFYKGSVHFSLRQFPQALAALQEAVRVNPDMYEAHQNLAVAYMVNCDYDAALLETDEALRLKPDSGGAYHVRGILLMSQGRVDEAAEALARAAELSPDDPAIHAALGTAYEALGRADEAAAAQQKALTLMERELKGARDDPQTIAAYADVLRSQGKLEEAVAEYGRAIQRAEKQGLRPDRLARIYRSLGLAYWDMERWEEMADAYNRAIALSPGLYSDHTALAQAYRGLGQPDQAVAAYEQALALLPCDANTHALLAGLYREMGRADEALAEYRLAAQYDPDDFTAWGSIGAILAERGQAGEAMAAYDKAVDAAERHLAHNPHDADAASMLGLTYLLLGQTEKAVSTLEQAVALRPNADNHYALGNAYYDTGDYEKALVEYQAALTADPKHVASAVRLGDTFAKLGRTDEAIAAYRQALALKDDADVHAYLGMLLAQQGQTQQAESEYRASLRLAENVLAHLGLATLYQSAGDLDQAIAEYQAALALQDAPYTRLALAWLYEAKGRLAEAASEYQAGIAGLGPGDPYLDSSRATLARVLLRLCRRDDALAVLQPSLSGGQGTPSVEVMSALAAVYEAQGKTAEAGETYTGLLRDNPSSPVAHYLAGVFAYRQGRLDEATREIDQTTKLAPAFSLAWSTLGHLYDVQGDLAAAKTAHEKALETMPSNVNGLVGLGVLALQQGKPDEALTYFQEALRQQPEYVKAVPDEVQAVLITIHLDLALAYERLGRADEAAQELATMRQLAEAAVAALPSHPQARFYLGVAYWVSGDAEQAEAAFAEAARCDASLAGERVRVQERIQRLRGAF